MTESDVRWMRLALAEAGKAAKKGEVPIGAVAVLNGRRVASAHNQTLALNDPTAHAEILVLRKAARRLKNYRLGGIIIYVTKEPCSMCRGALVWARVQRLVFGCPDVKPANHRYKVARGVLREESALLLQKFFRKRR